MKGQRFLNGLLLILILFFATLPGYGSQKEAGQSAIRPESIVKILKTHFQKIYPEQRYRIEVKELQGYEPVVIPSGILSCGVILPEQARRGGNISGVVVFSIAGQEVRRLRVSARVEIFGEVVSTRHYLKKHHEIQEKDLHLVERNISTLPPDAAMEMDDVLGKRTTLAVNSGEILRPGMIEVPPVIRKGDRVVLLVENNQFRITTLGESKEEGRKGDRVRLVNLSSRKEVYGRVLDGSTVQIEF